MKNYAYFFKKNNEQLVNKNLTPKLTSPTNTNTLIKYYIYE